MSHINKLESLQSMILRTIVKNEIDRYREKYKERTATHPNRNSQKKEN